jgi:chemotaxis protein histidine kinase CheA
MIQKVTRVRVSVRAQKSGTDIDDIISEAEVVLKKLGERMC